MPFGRKKSKLDDCRAETLVGFMNTSNELQKGGKVILDDDDTYAFTNFLASLDFDSDFTLAEIREIEKALRSIPREIVILNENGQESIYYCRVLDAIEKARMQTAHLKLKKILG